MVTVAPPSDAEAELEQLKRKLVRRFVAETTSPAARRRIRQAVEEATAVAWAAGIPLLLLPVLAEEMAATARLRADKQERIREQSERLLPELVER
ncbi:MAG: hypothetical protein HYZ36_02070 [Pedosphaera parvula]|nr:hypothetical protein [Pedosphaera parvula]